MAGSTSRNPRQTPATTPAPGDAPTARGGARRKKARFQPGSFPVLEGEEPWSTEELAEVRAILDEEVVVLRSEIAEAESGIADAAHNSSDGSGDDQADVGSKNFEREHEMSLTNNARDLLVQSDKALARIEAGTYGVCESCGAPIGKARLQAFPRATLDLKCKTREERR